MRVSITMLLIVGSLLCVPTWGYASNLEGIANANARYHRSYVRHSHRVRHSHHPRDAEDISSARAEHLGPYPSRRVLIPYPCWTGTRVIEEARPSLLYSFSNLGCMTLVNQ